MITQKVDIEDDVLGFIHGWVEKLAEKLDGLYVICLAAGKYHLPEKVKVYSLGKEQGISKLGQLLRFQKFLLRHIGEVDGVFCHMCPIYAIAATPLTKIFRRKLVFWFAHYRKSFTLWLADFLASEVVTSVAQAHPIKTKKLKIIGQGINIEKFRAQEQIPDDKFNVLFLGRITPIKKLEVLIEALNILVNQKNIKNIHLEIVGAPSEIKGDAEYFEKIKNLAKEFNLENFVSFRGRVPNYQTPQIYNQADLFVNLARTGGFDKAILEAMACQTPVLICNLAFREIFPKDWQELLIFEEGNPLDLAEKIFNLINMPQDQKKIIGQKLREIIIENHSLNHLADKLIQLFS